MSWRSVRRRIGLSTALTLLISVFSSDPARGASRNVRDQPDDTIGPQIHVMYVLPSDAFDEQLDINGAILNSVSAIQTWLAIQTGGRRLRLDTFGGTPDVTFARLNRTDAEMQAYNAFVRDQIEAELKSRSYIQANKVYGVYYGGGSNWSCGGGAWPPTLAGQVGAMYLKGTPPNSIPCAVNIVGSSPTVPRYVEFGLLHEIMHTLGFVPTCAPHQTLAGHVSDDTRDLMYAGSLPWQLPALLDVGRDDYYNSSVPGCLDFAASPFLAGAGGSPQQGVDFDGDGRADVAVYRPSSGAWFTLKSSTGFSNYNQYSWGAIGDVPVSGDFDGDGKAEAAVYRPSDGSWYILMSSSAYSVYTHLRWGVAGDQPVPGDFDGDGKTDVAVYRPANGSWFILSSRSGFRTYSSFGWGVSTDMPMPGDFDGDGKTDITVYRPSDGSWYVLTSSSNFAAYNHYVWGLVGDTPLAGDFDGDGRTDVTVYRPSSGTWFILKSSTAFTTSSLFRWGIATDTPMAADFDGDAISDITAYRSSNGSWYVLRSSSGFTTYDAYAWGVSTDIPLPRRR